MYREILVVYICYKYTSYHSFYVLGCIKVGPFPHVTFEILPWRILPYVVLIIDDM